ncbi:hypothetical protein Tco_1404693 [Tanacetum coccineum]
MAQLNKKSNENADVLAQIQKNRFAIAALKNELRKLTGNSVNTKFAKPSILGKPVLQPHRNQSVVRQPTAFKSERPKISKPRFASQVDVNNDLSKPVTTHYLPKRRESAHAKPHYMIAPSSSRYSSNDIVHNHYLEEAKKKTQEHSRNSRNFSDSKHFVCSTCQKCVFNANHDSCVTKFLKEVNSRAKVPSNKTTNRNKPVEQIRVATKPNRQIPTGHRFSIKRTSTVHEKTTSPRSCLRWQPTGRILKTVCLRWVPTGKIFTSSTTKVDSEPPNGSKEDITNQCESEQALDVSADISENRASRNFDLMINIMTFEHSSSSLGRQCQMVSAENNTSGPVPQFKFKAGSKSCSLSKQDSYITTRVGITIPPSHSNAEDNRNVYGNSQFDKPLLLDNQDAQRIPKPSVLGKPTPFSNSPSMRSFQMKQNAVPHASRNTNPHVSKSSGVNHNTSVSRPQLKCYQVKDKVVPNNSQVKFNHKEVEEHHRISSISRKTKSVTACNDSSNSRTSNVNAVCAECRKYVFNSNHDACVSRYLNDVNARTKKPNVVPISASKPKRKMNKSIATPYKKIVASDTTIQKSKS